MKSQRCQHVAARILTLCAAVVVILWLILWTEAVDLHSLPLRWDTYGRFPSPALVKKVKYPCDEFVQQRGVGLLHSYTDAELFIRALVMENTNALRSNVSDNLNSTKPKIAFLFLIRGDLPFAPLWNRFFRGNEGLYNIYVHMWPLKLSSIQKSMGVFWGRLIPSEEGRRLTPGLIADARRLLANALLDDVKNEWFAVVSESCIPLHGFRHTYEVLSSSSKTFMESNSQHWDMWSRYLARGDNAMKPEIEYWQFRVGSQFWVMRRKHALMTVGDIKYWTKFNQPCVPEHIDCYPEEHYFPTLLNILDPGGTTTYTATYVDWSEMEAPFHPKRFLANEVTRDLISNLQKLGNSQFLFARKFDGGCLGPLLTIADAILEY